MADSVASPMADAQSHAAKLRGLIEGYWITQAVYVAAKLGIADLLKGGAQPAAALAKATSTHALSLLRLLRLLASAGVFTETDDGRFALTPLATLLQAEVSGSQRLYALSPQLWWRSAGDCLYSIRTGMPAYDHLHGVGFHEGVERDSEDGSIYNSLLATATARDAEALSEVYDFGGFQTVIDIGGGYGSFIAAILKRHPHLRGVLFDRTSVTAGARRLLEAEGLTSSCDIIAGDFFDAVPDGIDVYVLKWVLIGWDDAHTEKLLRNCRQAMANRGTMLIVEPIIPTGNAPHPTKLLDINMLINFGGRLRTEAEYEALFTATGFIKTRMIATETPSQYCVIEALPGAAVSG